MGGIPADLLLYIIVAVVLVIWLRNTIGTRDGSERQRPNPFAQNPDKEIQKNLEINDQDSTAASLPLAPPSAGLKFKGSKNIEEKANAGLQKIIQDYRSFDPEAFVEIAKDAFVVIVEAYAEGDKETLKELLSPSVFEGFESAIDARDKKGETVETEIHAVKEACIIDAGVESKQAFISLRIKAQETVVIRDKKGKITGGHPDLVTEMDDIWVFSRHLKSKDPTWRLYETRDGEPEDHKTPIPEVS